MSYILLALLLILVVVVQCWTRIRSSPHPPTHPPTASSNSSLVEGFTRKFFTQIPLTYFVGMDYSQLLGNDYLLIERIEAMVPYNIDQYLVQNSIDRYRLLNENKIQFILARSHTLHNIIYKTMPGLINLDISHMRFVCTLFTLYLNILSTALTISKFADLKQSGLTVNVGPKYSSDYFIALDLFLAYDLVIDQDIFVTYYDLPDLVAHYGEDVQVVILTQSHPDDHILSLTNKVLSRMVEIKKLNDGNIFHISLDEKDFYQEHPYYGKAIIEKDDLSQYYPNLVLYDMTFDPDIEEPLVVFQSRFINTMSIREHLMSNDQTTALVIAQLLYNMKLNLFAINSLPFVFSKIDLPTFAQFYYPIPVHEGAHDFYTKTGLYTNLSDYSCIMIDGKCTNNQLHEHHLAHNYGLTFNQRFNADITLNPYVPKVLTPHVKKAPQQLTIIA